jgi:two-component sensor histidine kinase
MPKDFDPTVSSGLGMKVISSLVNQLGGKVIAIENPTGRGACFQVRFGATLEA